jgi:hypothetical protein
VKVLGENWFRQGEERTEKQAIGWYSHLTHRNLIARNASHLERTLRDKGALEQCQSCQNNFLPKTVMVFAQPAFSEKFC